MEDDSSRWLMTMEQHRVENDEAAAMPLADWKSCFWLKGPNCVSPGEKMGAWGPYGRSTDRKYGVKWLMKVCEHYELSRSTLESAINLMDRYYGPIPPQAHSTIPTKTKDGLSTLLAILQICFKEFETRSSWRSVMHELRADVMEPSGIDPRVVVEKELKVVGAVGWTLSRPFLHDYMNSLLIRHEEHDIAREMCAIMMDMVYLMTDLYWLDHVTLGVAIYAIAAGEWPDSVSHINEYQLNQTKFNIEAMLSYYSANTYQNLRNAKHYRFLYKRWEVQSLEKARDALILPYPFHREMKDASDSSDTEEHFAASTFAASMSGDSSAPSSSATAKGHNVIPPSVTRSSLCEGASSSSSYCGKGKMRDEARKAETASLTHEGFMPNPSTPGFMPNPSTPSLLRRARTEDSAVGTMKCTRPELASPPECAAVPPIQLRAKKKGCLRILRRVEDRNGDSQ